MKRAAIFMLWDENGEVQPYVEFFLKGLAAVTDEIITVVNGALTYDAAKQLGELSTKVIRRENVGLDVWAYKTGIEAYEAYGLDSIDELILCNATCYGPIYPFTEMFDVMAQRDCDFWGVVKHPEQPNYLLPNKRGYIYEHIMSFFTVFRSRMLHSSEFLDYWHNPPAIKVKSDSVGLHETQFTRRFEKLGFVSDAYVDLNNYQGRCNNSSIILANELLIRDRCPLVKRRAFMFPSYGDLLEISSAHQTVELMRYLREQTDYDIGLIWQDMLRTQKMSVLKNNMHLTRIFSSDFSGAAEPSAGKRIAAVLRFSKPFYVDIARPFIEALPIDIKTIFICDDEEIAVHCREVLGEDGVLTLLSDTEEGRRLETAQLCRSTSERADYICCILDIGAVENRLRIGEEDLCRYTYASLLNSSGYIEHILAAFEEDPFLGAAMPVKAVFASFYSYKEAYDAPRQGKYRNAYLMCNLSVPCDDGVYSNTNSALWLRGETARAVFSNLADPRTAALLEQNDAADRIIPGLIQNSGYYIMSVTDTEDAAISADNQQYMQQKLVKLAFDKSKRRTWFFSNLFNTFKGLGASVRVAVSKEEILKMPFGFRELLLLLRRYPKNKLMDMKRKRGTKQVSSVGASLTAVNVEGKRLNLFFCSSDAQLTGWYITVNGRKFYMRSEMTPGQTLVRDYHRDFCGLTDAFVDVPLDIVNNAQIQLLNGDRQVSFRWTSDISYNALELRDYDLYCRIENGSLYIQTKDRFFWSSLASRAYGLRDKLALLFLACNKFHPLTLMAENLSAADNTFQLFQYALEKRERVYFVVSQQVRDTQPDAHIRSHMLVHNSRRHRLAVMLSKRWISSFSLRGELLPNDHRLKDIHFSFIPAEWVFIPHGMAVGDKLSGLFHRYNWDNPSRTYVSTEAERDAYSRIFNFQNVACLGAPRMDKWYGAKLDANEIFVYFTWRLSLTKNSKQTGSFNFCTSDYYNTIVDTMRALRAAYPDRRIVYAFHHEVVKQGYDAMLIDGMEGLHIEFVYLNSAQGAERFNAGFREAKYLITDISSVAFDFAYKEGAIPVYYQPDGFLGGHYEVEPVFYDIHLGVIAKTEEELCQAMSMETPSREMARRRLSFFKYLDGGNAARVYEAVFSRGAQLPVSKQTPAPKKAVKRLAIYLFFDEDGIVDDYVPYCLTQLKTVCTEVCVVVNGRVSDEGRAKLEASCDKLLLRENVGFDSWAYKQAIETYGFDRINSDFDELLLVNYTFYGPIYPFSEMFSVMDARENDLWGHTRYRGSGAVLGDTQIRIVDHIQSHFIVFRHSILSSPSFREYWDTLKQATNYTEAVAFHELRCLAFFETRGFISDVYMPWAEKMNWVVNPPVFYAYTQLTEYRSPLLKRKALYVKDGQFQFPQKDDHTPYEIIRFIRDHTPYDEKLILQNLKRTMPLYDCKESMVSECDADEIYRKEKAGPNRNAAMIKRNESYSAESFIGCFEEETK